MRHSARTLSLVTVVLLGILSGCTKKPDPSLYDPTWQSLPAPTITSLSPANAALAGVTVITITGTNFSPTITQDLVYFGTAPGTVLTATATTLTVRPPLVVQDSLKVTVAVQGSQYFSNYVAYSLKSAVSQFSIPLLGEDPNGIASDASGNIFVSLVGTASQLGLGTWKIAQSAIAVKRDTGTAKLYSTTSGVTKWSGLKMGPGGVLYAARSLRALYRIPAGGGAAAVWVTFAGGVVIQDFDFDANQNVWAGGPNTSIYRINPAGQVKAFPFVGTCRSFRVYNGSLYVAAKTDSLESIWSFPIVSSDSLGPPTKYFDFSARYFPNGPGAQCITFSSDGDLYIGTDAPEGIIVVHQGGASEPLYPGVLSPMPYAFAWGNGPNLFVARLGTTTPHGVFVVNTLKQSAPYYGLQ